MYIDNRNPSIKSPTVTKNNESGSGFSFDIYEQLRESQAPIPNRYSPFFFSVFYTHIEQF
mgnify:CR=1 FL=1